MMVQQTIQKNYQGYASTDPRMYLISKENGGVASARNAALDHLSNLKYDWVSFLDADDIYGIDNLANLKEIICNNPEVDYIRTHCKSYTNRTDMLADASAIHPHAPVKAMNPTIF